MLRILVVATAVSLVLPLAAQDDQAPAKDIVTKPSIVRKVAPQYSDRARKERIEGTVKLKLIVAPDGRARDIEVVKSLDPELDINAITAVAGWIFNPGTQNGEPVAVDTTVEVSFNLLKEASPDDKALSANDVTKPSIIRKVEPWYSKKAEKKKIEGVVKLTTVISADGHARDIKVVESLDPELDANAIAALEKWIFKPGTKNGEPVACVATIEMRFHLLHH
ncbi:MAG: energy transducer TonB [Bryobacteraceae bacterium]